MGKKENDIENYLIKEAEKRDMLCYKFVSPGRTGVPDRILIGKGKTIFLELKTDEGRPSARQISVIKAIRRHGGDARLCYSRTAIDNVFQELDALPDLYVSDNTVDSYVETHKKQS